MHKKEELEKDILDKVQDKSGLIINLSLKQAVQTKILTANKELICKSDTTIFTLPQVMLQLSKPHISYESKVSISLHPSEGAIKLS
jgi:hypothetical protein